MILQRIFDCSILFFDFRIPLLRVERVRHDAVEDFGWGHEVLLCLASLTYNGPKRVHTAIDAVFGLMTCLA